MAESDEQRRDQPETPPEDAHVEGDLAQELERWKALARQHEKRAKANAEAERQLSELQERDKSELQKAQEAARSWQQRAETAELQALRMEVAARKGLTTAQAKRLQGTTEEELADDADELLAAFRPSSEAAPSSNGADTATNGGRADRAPVPKLRPGAVPGASHVEMDPAKLAAQISRHSF